MIAQRWQSTEQSYSETNITVAQWNPSGPKDNPEVLLSARIAINGNPYTIYAFRVFDPEMMEICPPGTISWEHLDAYGPILWNVEHGQKYLEYCLKSEQDNNSVPQPAPYLPTRELTQLEDWLDAVLSTFTSDHTLTPPRIVLGGHPYILTMIPVAEDSTEIHPVELTSQSWLPYVTGEQGYKETLIKIDNHLLKIKAFEIFEQTKDPVGVNKYSTGSTVIEDILEQHQYILKGYNQYKKVESHQPTPSISVSGHNFLLFGISAVVEEEQRKYEKYQEEKEVEKILPQGILEYRFDQHMPEEWGSLIDFIAENICEPVEKEAEISYVLDVDNFEQAGNHIPENMLEWLNGTTDSILYRFARWYKKNKEGDLELNPENFDLSLEWTRTIAGFTTHINSTTAKLLRHLETGAATRTVKTGEPLRIII